MEAYRRFGENGVFLSQASPDAGLQACTI